MTSRAAIHLLLITTLCLAAGAPSAKGAARDGYRAAVPDYSWEFPRDHSSHPEYQTEWWYFTGQLEATSGERYGYQLTLFRIALAPPSSFAPSASAWTATSLVMGHASVSELSSGRHRFSELLFRAAPMLGGFPSAPSSTLAWSRAPAGTDTTWSVAWEDDRFELAMRDRRLGFAFRLAATPERALVLQGPNGFSQKGPSPTSASQYYSFSRLVTVGTLELDGETRPVTGRSWMDHEFGSNQLTADQAGWDWWSLQLDDGRDLMLYRMRRADGTTDYARGTLVGENGPRYLSQSEWTTRSNATWKSAASGAEYPSRWEVEVPSASLRLQVVPEMADQENVAPRSGGVHYWEGAVRVLDAAGRRVGQGYVELTGYGRGSRPPI